MRKENKVKYEERIRMEYRRRTWRNIIPTRGIQLPGWEPFLFLQNHDLLHLLGIQSFTEGISRSFSSFPFQLFHSVLLLQHLHHLCFRNYFPAVDIFIPQYKEFKQKKKQGG